MQQQVQRRAAVILAGCGVYDGSEIMETTAMLFSLHEQSYDVQCFAPNITQHHVVNHTNGEEMQQERNVMVEASRICRGNIKDLEELSAEDFDALLLPGGFGAGKNLSTYAINGADMTVLPQVEKVLKEFHGQKKVIAGCCIAPIILAKVLGNVKLTLGMKGDTWPYDGTIDVAEGFGAQLESQDHDGVTIDQDNRVVTAPAFMKEQTNYHLIYQNVRAMVQGVTGLLEA